MVAARETTFRSCWRGPSSAKFRCIGAPYSWSKAQLTRLWEDITRPTDDRVTDRDATHFIGSPVSTPSPSQWPGQCRADPPDDVTSVTRLLLASKHPHSLERNLRTKLFRE